MKKEVTNCLEPFGGWPQKASGTSSIGILATPRSLLLINRTLVHSERICRPHGGAVWPPLIWGLGEQQGQGGGQGGREGWLFGGRQGVEGEKGRGGGGGQAIGSCRGVCLGEGACAGAGQGGCQVGWG